MKIQLWSYNYDPEPTGIAPVSTCLAKGLLELGHDVDVVAAHPHYPEPRWGTKVKPYREVRDGVPVLRLPLWIGRDSALERYRQELSYMAALTLAAPFAGKPDVLIAASPSFPALAPTVLATTARRVPWLLWLHDILPDGAAASGIVDESSAVIRASRKLERAAYKS
ncbi:MAG TPA: glycosyltransferase, partial [Solirubrobacteraceae bacterium]